MRLFFRLVFAMVIFASLPTIPAQAQGDGAAYLATYLEALPVAAQSAQSAVAVLAHYRDSSRKEAGNLGFDVLTELGRSNRFVILEAWRDAASLDAHNKSDSTAKYHQTMETMQSAPPDIRNTAALLTDSQPHDIRPSAIYVVTHVDVTGDHKDDAVTLLRSMRDETMKDEGNLRYDVLQQKNRPNHFTVVEAWTDRRTQADHAAAAHTRAFRQQLLPMQGALYDERLYVALP